MIYNIDFDKIVICSPSLDSQKEYQIFIKALNNGLDLGDIEQLFLNQDEIEDVDKEIEAIAAIKKEETGETIEHIFKMNQMNQNTLNTSRDEEIEPMVTIYKDPELMPSPEELRQQFGPKTKILVVVDDCMQRKQGSIESLFIYGRPLGIQTIYLTQSFFETDKNSIRGNCNAFIFFETSMTDLKNSYEQVGARGFECLEDYKNYARRAWSDDHGYFFVDLAKKKEGSSEFKMSCF